MTGETAVVALRAARDRVAVLKVQLAGLRARGECRLVIVIEGKDDLAVYETWISRLDPGYEWEPLIANGKRNALEFREMLRRDRTGIGACTYFIVDHDYDGLNGHSSGDDIFVLPAYSIENYLTDEVVLESHLRAELGVVGTPDDRVRIRELFVGARMRFLAAIEEACIVLYGARNDNVGNVTVRDAVVSVRLVHSDVVVSVDVRDLVTTEVPVSESSLDAARSFFRVRDFTEWVRGKYLLSFFKKFCDMLHGDRISERPQLFSERVHSRSRSAGALDLRTLCARSRMPAGLKHYLSLWRTDCLAQCGS